jgi:methylenetetrahydrofolate--tRNA-(uracil-5-)-methyltransferase
MMGALIDFISSASPKHFQPMPPNFGILPELPQRIRNKQERYGTYRDRAFQDLERWAQEQNLVLQAGELSPLSA